MIATARNGENTGISVLDGALRRGNALIRTFLLRLIGTLILTCAVPLTEMPNAVKTILYLVGAAVGLYTAIDAFRGYWRMYREYGPGVHAAAHQWWALSPVRATVSVAIIAAFVAATGFLLWVRRPPPVPTERAFAAQPPPASKELEDLGKRFDNLTQALARNPSLDADAKLSILKDDYDRLSKKKDELTTQEKQTLDSQALTLQSLEEGRKKHLEAKELEKQQSDLASQRATLEREEQIKKAEKKREPEELAFAGQYAPVTDYIITTLYQMLRQISVESGEPISTDFPNDHPSLDSSKIYKDGKIVGGKQVMRVGTSKDWEFELWVAGPPNPLEPRGPTDRRRFSASIRAGLACIVIVNPEIEPPRLRVTLTVDRAPGMRSRFDKPLYEQDCLLSDCQKIINQALRELIQNRYIATPLNPKP
jgi:hypothetical protein